MIHREEIRDLKYTGHIGPYITAEYDANLHNGVTFIDNPKLWNVNHRKLALWFK